MQRSILVIDDEQSICRSLKGALGDEGYNVHVAHSGEEGLTNLTATPCDIVLLDIWMPHMDGLEVLRRIKADNAAQLVIMMSGHGTIETAVKATKLGAYDFVEKPINLEKLLTLLTNAGTLLDVSRENQSLRRQVQKQKQLIAQSASMLAIKDLIAKVAPTTGSVLILGENGTGKELIAHAIHTFSHRYSKPFVEVNCAAIPEELIESELFGHEKGAFTGATQLRRGKFDIANGGTLFLDEIGDMSIKTQAKILRILQDQKFERVGGSQTIGVDVRIVAATNKDLKSEIQKGHFREDLYYRLNVIRVVVPPLRERPEDIPLLADYFMREFSSASCKKARTYSSEAIALLHSYPWPGNVRELKNLIERMVILGPDSSPDSGDVVGAQEVFQHLQEEMPPATEIATGEHQQTLDFKSARQDFERDYIVRALEQHKWSVSKAAQALGIERSYLHKKMKSFGIEAH